MIRRNMSALAAVAVLIGCSSPPPPPAPETAAATADTTQKCEPPSALANVAWTVFATVKQNEYFEQPERSDRMTVTCEARSGREYLYLHFEGPGTGSGQKKFADISEIPFIYVSRNGPMSSPAEKFEAQERHAEHLKEIVNADYDYLISSGVVRAGDQKRIAVAAVAVPWTLTGVNRNTFSLVLVNLGELKLKSDAQPEVPADVEVKQGGVIHGRF